MYWLVEWNGPIRCLVVRWLANGVLCNYTLLLSATRSLRLPLPHSSINTPHSRYISEDHVRVSPRRTLLKRWSSALTLLLILFFSRFFCTSSLCRKPSKLIDEACGTPLVFLNGWSCLRLHEPGAGFRNENIAAAAAAVLTRSLYQVDTQYSRRNIETQKPYGSRPDARVSCEYCTLV